MHSKDEDGIVNSVDPDCYGRFYFWIIAAKYCTSFEIVRTFIILSLTYHIYSNKYFLYSKCPLHILEKSGQMTLKLAWDTKISDLFAHNLSQECCFQD